MLDILRIYLKNFGEMMDNVILIPARSGSTRVKDKNIRNLGGKPLLSHIIKISLQSKIGRVIVSTNSQDIANIAKEYGAEIPFMRPESLSTSKSTSISVIIHTLLWLKNKECWTPNKIAFCPPTNPFLQSKSLINMFRVLEGNFDKNSIVSVTQPKSHPFRLVNLEEDGTLQNGIISLNEKTINDVERSQDWPPVWEGSPACRLSKTKYFFDKIEKEISPLKIKGKTYDASSCIGYEISQKEAFDIDDLYDFKIAEALFQE